MPNEITGTSLRQNLDAVLDRVIDDRRPIAHLLRSPKNAKRLLAALRRANKGVGRPESLDKLRREMGLAPAR